MEWIVTKGINFDIPWKAVELFTSLDTPFKPNWLANKS